MIIDRQSADGWVNRHNKIYVLGPQESDGHRIRRSHRLRMRAPAGARRLGSSRRRQRYAAAVLRPGGDDARRSARPGGVRSRLPPLRSGYPRPPGRARSGGRRAARLHHPHGGPALARQSGVDSVRRFRRQRGRHHEHAGGRARLLPGIAVLLHQHQQGVRRSPELPAAPWNWKSATTTPTAWTASTRTCRSTTACTRFSAPPKWRPT